MIMSSLEMGIMVKSFHGAAGIVSRNKVGDRGK
jgi:hypothetical protein